MTNDTPKKNIWNYISIAGTVLSSTWNYTKKGLIWGSRIATKYGGNALLVGAVATSAITYGQSIDSDTQLKKAQESITNQKAELQQLVDQAQAIQSSALPSITNTLSELQIIQQNAKNDAEKSIGELKTQSDTNTQLSQQLNSNLAKTEQNLQNISQKTIKAEADLKEVFGKIDDANVTLDTLSDKAKKIVDELSNATADLNLKNTLQDTSLSDNLKAIDVSFQGLYNSVNQIGMSLKKLEGDTEADYVNINILHNALRSDFDALVVDYSANINNLKNSISSLQNGNITKDTADATRDTRLDILESKAPFEAKSIRYGELVGQTDGSGVIRIDYSPPFITDYPKLVWSVAPFPPTDFLPIDCMFYSGSSDNTYLLCFQNGTPLINSWVDIYYVAIVQGG